MLIGLKTNYFGVTITFRALGVTGEVIRSVELSLKDAEQLAHDLQLLLRESPPAQSSYDRRGHLREAEEERH